MSEQALNDTTYPNWFAIVVTGDRHWEDEKSIEESLIELTETSLSEKRRILLAHGDCKTGADRIADKIAKARGWKIMRFPADWERYGKGAGPMRNSDMVSVMSPDAALVCLRPESKGTRNCLTILNSYKSTKGTRLKTIKVIKEGFLDDSAQK